MDIKKYSKETQKQLKAIVAFIKERYGKFPMEWEINLRMIADNLDLYEKVMDSLNKSELINEKGVKNPLLVTQKELQVNIMKLQAKMGLSAYDASRLKVSDSDSVDLLSTILAED